MSDLITVQGVVLSAMPIGEYDKRLVLLTKERGKISVFAKGARRPNSPYLAAANPFVFGSFTLYEGRSSYNLNQVSVTSHFTEIAGAQPEVYYGFYFLEVADYYGREGNNEIEMINLLYVSLKALLNPQIENPLIRYTFEFRVLVIQGESPEIYQCVSCQQQEELQFFSQNSHGMLCRSCARQVADARPVLPSVIYALQYIAGVPLTKLYSFTVKQDVLEGLKKLVGVYFSRQIDKKLKSLEILKIICGTGI